jgi:hypothetical protein
VPIVLFSVPPFFFVLSGVRRLDVALCVVATVEVVAYVVLQVSQWKKMVCCPSEDLSITLSVGHAG